MLTAININGIRITPFSNEKGFCPLCKSEVIKAVGEIYTPHFRHKTLQNCDTWSEGETEWHYNWKQKFPIDWQEVIIEKNGEVHRADIKTENGLILELQNSSISTTTIEIREHFYENMVWLINAEKFKDNFNIRSVVRQKLREVESYYSHSVNYNTNNKTPLIEDLEERLEDKNRTHKQTLREVEYLYDDLRSILKKKDDFSTQLADYIKGNYSSLLYEFKTEEKEKIKELNNSLIKLNEDLEKTNNVIKQINSFENCTIKEYSHWKVLNFDIISPESQSQCKIIFKDTANTFFPDIIDIQNSAQFQNYRRSSEKYILILDLTKRIFFEEEQVKNIKTTIEETNHIIENLTNSISKQLSEWLNGKERGIRDTINNKNKINEDLEKEIIILGNKLDSEIEIEKKKKAESSNKLAKLHTQEQISIKMENKGKYTYHWKNKRKTWEYASMPVYLDFGDCIFEVLNDYKLSKMTIQDFIERIKNY